MAGKVFRIIAAFTMLVLYTSVLVAGDIVSLTCHCNSHSGDVHTAFNHVHKCEVEHCQHHDDAGEEYASTQVSKQRCCNHDHSNRIHLYVQPRTNDDNTERQAMLLTVVTDIFDYNEEQMPDMGQEEYGECISSSPLEGYARSGVLRAPPALV